MERLIALLLLLPVLASAGPGGATRYLINEPASLMDIGIDRGRYAIQDLQSYLEEAVQVRAGKSTVNSINTMMYYHFSDDRS